MSDSRPIKPILLHPSDNVAVSPLYLNKDTVVQTPSRNITVREVVRVGHKLAIDSIPSGEQIRKYGEVIGVASQDVEPGQWVHSHNLRNIDEQQVAEKATQVPPPPSPQRDYSFQGYRRPNGRAGTRNYFAVISTVNCSASVAKAVAARLNQELRPKFPNIDGVVAFTHETGCGMPFQGESHQMLNRVLAGIARHPNIGGYAIIGLGCEQNTLGGLVGDYQLRRLPHLSATLPAPTITIQDHGGTMATIENACDRIRKLLPEVDQIRRDQVPASELVVATECGGSDAYSGITANPAVGKAADRLVSCGATVCLAETTEVYGAEHLLTRRAVDVSVADRLLEKIEWWKWYTGVFGAELDNNPSPGNKEGGLTTIAEKSLGAIAKGGSTALRAVFDYAEPMNESGFVFMDTPGFDPPSVTGMVAGGANIVLFTTGRGSCFGCKPSPSIKIATNTPMYERMVADMDVNAGKILESTTVDQVGDEIFQLILRVASGEKTCSEQLGIGDEEFVPWTIGPVL